jgi:hypothetical protein
MQMNLILGHVIWTKTEKIIIKFRQKNIIAYFFYKLQVFGSGLPTTIIVLQFMLCHTR